MENYACLSVNYEKDQLWKMWIFAVFIEWNILNIITKLIYVNIFLCPPWIFNLLLKTLILKKNIDLEKKNIDHENIETCLEF